MLCPTFHRSGKEGDEINLLAPHVTNLSFSGGGGGGFTGNFFFFAQITAKAFSYIRTEFGARPSKRVGVRSATN